MVEERATRYEELAVKAADGLLTTDEERELRELIAGEPERSAEVADFLAIKEATDAMRTRILDDAALEPVRESSAVKVWLWGGMLALLAGIVVLLGFGGLQVLTAPDVPIAIKIGLGAIAVGAAMLLGYVAFRRARGFGKDPYEEVDR